LASYDNKPSACVSRYKSQLSTLNYKNLQFPLAVNDVSNFEKLNPDLSINVLGIERDKFSGELIIYFLYPSMKSGKKIDLFLLQNEENETHYCLVRNLSRLVSSTVTSSKKKIHLCYRCFCYFFSLKKLMEHNKLCENFSIQTVTYPQKPYNYLKFSKFAHLQYVNTVIFADFETVMLQTSELNETSQGINEKEMKVISFAYLAQRSDGTTFPVKKYAGENAIKYFFQCMENEEESMLEYYEKCNKSKLSKVKRNNEDNLCWICQKIIFTLAPRHLDHCHATNKVRGYVHPECNAKLRMPKLLVVAFHCSSIFDSHFIIKNLAGYQKRIYIIPKTSERYIGFSLNKTKYLDTFQFLPASLAELINNVSRDGKSDNLKILPKFYSGLKLKLILQKLPFPYSFLSGYDCLKAKMLPDRSFFKSDLDESEITQLEYKKAQRIWQIFKCKNFKDFLLLYNEIDVLQLAEIMTHFRETSFKNYSIDPFFYYSLPGYSWDCFLRQSKVKLELISDSSQFLFFESAIRGGLVDASIRYMKANHKYLSSYDSSKPDLYILLLDASALYSSSMCFHLPYSTYRWLSDHEIKSFQENIINMKTDGEFGYFVECDLVIPLELHDIFQYYPLLPTKEYYPDNKLSPYMLRIKNKQNIKRAKVEKLITSLNPKYEYKVHFKLLQLYLKLGVRLVKVHKVLSFKQKPFLKNFIMDIIQKRQGSKNDFEKNLFKLFSNSIYGQTARNKRKERNIKIITDANKAKKINKNPLLQDFTIYEENLVSAELKRKTVCLNRPMQLAATILDLSKYIMYSFVYITLKSIFPEPGQVKIGYYDTDSVLMAIKTPDVYKIISENKSLFDLSNYHPDHFCFSNENRMKLFTFKDETAGKPIKEAVMLRPKTYSLLIEGDKCISRAKGVPKKVMSKFTHSHYRKILFYESKNQVNYKRIISKNHKVFIRREKKLALNCFPSDKRWYYGRFGEKSFPFGHYRINKMKKRENTPL
jgi:hypothetical protein